MAGLLELGGELSEPERELVRTVAKLRLMTHAQLAVLLATETTAPLSARLDGPPEAHATD